MQGFVNYQLPDGKIQGQYLASHSYFNMWRGENDTEEGHYRYFLQNLALNRFAECFKAATFLANVDVCDFLGRRCLQFLEFDIAIRAF